MKKWRLMGLCLLLSGCTQWPDAGYGGLAEVRPTNLPVNEDERKVWLHYDKRQQELDSQLEQLKRAYLRECMPAELEQLQSKRVDILRDMHGRLWSEVSWRQAMLAQSLKQIRLRLAQTTGEGCRSDWSGVPLRSWGQT
ncbi:hypothetical protein CUC53_00065 [Aeromonas cavernicola]|uniref:Lipoprotein n=1 Tax=Aeromonas cavernicola TaxID=1006623 RepID=A0A2H9U9R8_9GAMM|nr:hypothetical protein CUC53_00065 [Aeromonas cavernicola]